MKTFSIGISIKNIKDFERFAIFKTDVLLEKEYTPKELAYCYSKQFPAQHLAVRYAAKEAIIQALSEITTGIFEYQDIQITNNKNGSPNAILLKDGFNDIIICLSLSHSQDLAIAFVTIERLIRKETVL